MIKYMTRVLSLALLAASFCGSATGANPPEGLYAKEGAQKTGRFCTNNSDGSQLTGVVVGIGADWWGANVFPFTISDTNGNLYTELPFYDISQTEGQYMFNALMTAWTMGRSVTVYCGENKVKGVWAN